jgi:hypothetical protein
MDYKPNEFQEKYPIDTPCTKMMYKSESDVKAAILQLGKANFQVELSYYACVKCGFYHLTRFK